MTGKSPADVRDAAGPASDEPIREQTSNPRADAALLVPGTGRR